MRPSRPAPLSFVDVEADTRSLGAGARPAAHDAATAMGPRPVLGTPVTFGDAMGFFYPGTGSLAVLMLGAVGYEEFCLRTTWRCLAEHVAATGVPCLRFDYPGQADALDPPGGADGLDDWRETARRAADLLRAATGVARIVLVGHGLGAALAAAWAADLGAIDACVLMAPVGNGRRHLRELAIWARIVNDRIGLAQDPAEDTGCGVAGFAPAAGRIAAIRALDLAALPDAPAHHVLVVGRPGVAGDDAIAAQLSNAGATVTRLAYIGHEVLTVDPSTAVPPGETLAAVADWIARRTAALEAPRSPARPGWSDGSCAPLRGSGFAERPLRFGPGGRLFGVLCEPDARAAGTAVVMIGAGRDYHIGWGRMTVDQARALARAGFASLRFDTSSFGDSPADPDGPAETLYSQAQIDDVRTAIDLLEAVGYGDIVLCGRCSGSYAAFTAAVEDARVGHVVSINPPRFVWDPEENVEEALRYAHRSLGDFGATFLKRDGFRRLFSGRMRVAAGLRHIAGRIATAASERLAPLLGSLTRQGRLHREVHRRMAVLASRGTRLSLVFSDRDPGLPDLFRRFGRDARDLSDYVNTSLVYVEDADHNFTHAGARSRLLAVMLAAVAS